MAASIVFKLLVCRQILVRIKAQCRCRSLDELRPFLSLVMYFVLLSLFTFRLALVAAAPSSPLLGTRIGISKNLRTVNGDGDADITQLLNEFNFAQSYDTFGPNNALLTL